VYGNIDGQEIRAIFPEDLIFTLNNVKVYMTHIGGYPSKYNARSKQIILQEKPHLFISGHSHILKVMPDPSRNLLHINPGACGKQGWHKVCTLVRFTVEGPRIHDLEVIEFPKGQ
ncbi:MAG: metallophosphoesterase family protein, partial [Chitinophagaceae bacterium]|nr:metallophosphoesterase family protein [Chitinophagaceae bacterium]